MQSFKQKPDELEEFVDFFEADIENIRRVRKFCQKNHMDVKFEIHPKAETCDESAEHSDINMNRIVKTLIFKTDDDFIAALAPGNKRVDTEKLAKLHGADEIQMANPKEVQTQTGYVVGGVSPFDLEIPVYMEESLLDHETVRPAAGSRVVGVEITPRQIRDIIVAECESIVN